MESGPTLGPHHQPLHQHLSPEHASAARQKGTPDRSEQLAPWSRLRADNEPSRSLEPRNRLRHSSHIRTVPPIALVPRLPLGLPTSPRPRVPITCAPHPFGTHHRALSHMPHPPVRPYRSSTCLPHNPMIRSAWADSPACRSLHGLRGYLPTRTDRAMHAGASVTGRVQTRMYLPAVHTHKAPGFCQALMTSRAPTSTS
jgi:hypothetical protein